MALGAGRTGSGQLRGAYDRARRIARNGDLRVVNPLQGALERWTRARFKAAWQLLGRRALAVRR